MRWLHSGPFKTDTVTLGPGTSGVRVIVRNAGSSLFITQPAVNPARAARTAAKTM